VSTPVRFLLSYLAVLSTMLVWWLVMKRAAVVGPVPLLVVAYAVPVGAWWMVVARTRGGRAVRDEP